MPKGVRRGVCRECGRDSYSAESTYCEDHRPLRSDRAPKPGKAATGARRAGELEQSLRTQLGMAAMLWSVSDPVCGQALAGQVDEIAAFWADRARNNARIAAVIEGVTSTGGWLGGLVVHAPLLIAIWAHHVAPVIEARRAAAAGETEDDDGGPRDPWPPSVPGVDLPATHGHYPTADPNDPAAAAAWGGYAPADGDAPGL